MADDLESLLRAASIPDPDRADAHWAEYRSGGPAAEAAFRTLLAWYGLALYRRVWGFVRSDAADDVFQDVLAKLHRHRAKLATWADAHKWLRTVAVREAVTQFRRDRRRQAREARRALRPDDADPGDGAVTAVACAELRAALVRLPEAHRQVVALLYFEGLSVVEAGRVLGKDRDTVAAWRDAALGRLRRLLPAGGLLAGGSAGVEGALAAGRPVVSTLRLGELGRAAWTRAVPGPTLGKAAAVLLAGLTLGGAGLAGWAAWPAPEAAQVPPQMAAGVRPPATDPSVGWWGGDGNARDASRYGGHAALRNGAGFAPGRVGPAFAVADPIDAVVIPHAPQLDFERTQPFSIEGWARVTSTARPDAVLTLFNKGVASGANASQSYGIAVRPSGVWVVDVWLQGQSHTDRILWRGPVGVDAGDWHHYAMTYDGRSRAAGVRVYVDGWAIAPSHLDDGLTTSIRNAEPATIGAGFGAGGCGGLIDEVGVHARALSAADVQGLFAAGRDGARRALPLRPGVAYELTDAGELVRRDGAGSAVVQVGMAEAAVVGGDLYYRTAAGAVYRVAPGGTREVVTTGASQIAAFRDRLHVRTGSGRLLARAGGGWDAVAEGVAEVATARGGLYYRTAAGSVYWVRPGEPPGVQEAAGVSQVAAHRDRLYLVNAAGVLMLARDGGEGWGGIAEAVAGFVSAGGDLYYRTAAGAVLRPTPGPDEVIVPAGVSQIAAFRDRLYVRTGSGQVLVRDGGGWTTIGRIDDRPEYLSWR